MSDLKIPSDLKYTESDEWIKVDGDIATVGITDFAQDALNDIVYIELREVGDSLAVGEGFGEVESVKASSEMYLPFAGEITAVNDALEDSPETINADPYGDGWMVKVKISDGSGLNDLMDAVAYAEHCANR